jgi:hypothetical protein
MQNHYMLYRSTNSIKAARLSWRSQGCRTSANTRLLVYDVVLVSKAALV